MTEDGFKPTLQWARDRAWVQHEIDTHEGSDDWVRGFQYAMRKVYGRMFLTPDERAAVAQAGRDMGF
jgi:hypothetical protein